MIQTRLTDLLGLRYPVISAPMVAQSGGVLAGAVSKAGGLGSFGAVSPLGNIAVDYIAENIAKARTQTDRAFGIGFNIPFIEANRANFDFVLDAEVPVILLSFGDPRPWLTAIKARGRRALCQVQTMQEAHWAVEGGTDVLAVQGAVAGGHCGELSLMPFLAGAADAFPETPIVAAGGIADGRTLAAVLAAGADGAWIGTAFRTVSECLETAPAERAAIFESDGTDTARSSVYDVIGREALGGGRWPEGIAMRARLNPLVRRWMGREEELALRVAGTPEAFRHVWDDAAGADYGHLFGEAAKFVTAEESAGDFLHRISGTAERLLSRFASARAEPSVGM